MTAAQALDVAICARRWKQLGGDALRVLAFVVVMAAIVWSSSCSPTTAAIEADTVRLSDCEARYTLADTLDEVRAVDVLCVDGGAP